MVDAKTRELIAVGASVVAKCQPCLDHHLQEARKEGASDAEIRTAIGIARMVRKAGEENMDKYTDDRVRVSEREPAGPCCSGSASPCCGGSE